MTIFGFEFGKSAVAARVDEPKDLLTVAPVEDTGNESRTAQPSAYVGYGEGAYYGNPVAIISRPFNGEKTPGELGNPINLVHDYNAIRARAYHANGTSDVIKIITGKLFDWVQGSGLKLQSEPNEEVLKLEKAISKDYSLTKFVSDVEAYWSVYSNSKTSDHGGMYTLHENALRSYMTSFIGGDCLNVLRVDENFNVTVQIIDGQHVRQPILQGKWLAEAKDRGNKVRNGIEIGKRGNHVAFYVYKQSDSNLLGEIERIEAVGAESGCLMAWMTYGDKHRIDHDRGISELTTILEKVAKLDRYTEATVGSAEEAAKIPWTIKHNQFSNGEDPLQAMRHKMVGAASTVVDPYVQGEVVANKISATEGKTVVNLPIGAELDSLDSNRETNYDPFFTAIFKQISACAKVPYEVALQMYNSNYSASRAAINGWGYGIDIKRQDRALNFYQNVYNLKVYVLVLQNKVEAPGYLKAKAESNWMVIESYCKARFTGVNMPSIDPKKEADAVRKMLGDDSTPLMTYEQATEQLGNGSFAENTKKLKEERNTLPDLLPDQQPKVAPQPGEKGAGNPAPPKEKKVKPKTAVK
jgi:capsid protein